MKTGVDMRVSLGRLHMDNPVMVASGTFGFAAEYAHLMDVNELGAVVTKGISIEPRAGNPYLNRVMIQDMRDFVGRSRETERADPA